jgi:hypothetical protein
MWQELLGVGVQKADQVALEHRQRAPHRVALSEHGAPGAHQLRLLPDGRTGARGKVGGAVAGGRIDDDDLIDHAGPAQGAERADDLTDGLRVFAGRQAHRHAEAALGEGAGDAGRRIGAVVKGARFLAHFAGILAVARGQAGHRLYYRNTWPEIA